MVIKLFWSLPCPETRELLHIKGSLETDTPSLRLSIRQPGLFRSKSQTFPEASVASLDSYALSNKAWEAFSNVLANPLSLQLTKEKLS